MSELSSTLARHAQATYPRIAQRRGWEGEVQIQFTLLANGDIVDIKIKHGSGRNLLDQAALEIFTHHMHRRFKPFPQEIKRRHWTHSVPIEYKLR